MPPSPIAFRGYGERIAAARIDRGQTAEELAAELGVPVELIRLWEADALAPDAAGLAKMVRAGIDVGWVLVGERREPSSGRPPEGQGAHFSSVGRRK